MSYGPSFHDNQPITHIKRVPIYATTILTAVFALGIVVWALLKSAGANILLLRLQFYTSDFLHGAYWQPLTYVWLQRPDFFAPLWLLCFYAWAIEVEKYLGRARFLTLFGLLVATPVVLGLGVHFFSEPTSASGNTELTAALLIAFATLYPNIEYLNWFLLKWFAFVCLAIGSLMYFPARDWIGLFRLWATCGVAFGYIRWVQHGGEISLPKFRIPSFRPRPKLRVLPDPIPRAEQVELDEEDESMAEVDVLLDKIAKSGIGSLTPKERQRLEKAREELMKRESPRR